MFREIIENYLSSLSTEELVDLLGGSAGVVQIFIEALQMCSKEQKIQLRRAFLGEEIWQKLQKIKLSDISLVDDIRLP